MAKLDLGSKEKLIIGLAIAGIVIYVLYTLFYARKPKENEITVSILHPDQGARLSVYLPHEFSVAVYNRTNSRIRTWIGCSIRHINHSTWYDFPAKQVTPAGNADVRVSWWLAPHPARDTGQWIMRASAWDEYPSPAANRLASHEIRFYFHLI